MVVQGAAERAEKQGRLEKKELQEELESIEAQMQVLIGFVHHNMTKVHDFFVTT